MSRPSRFKRLAFTLVEVLIVIAIIGILMGLVLAGVRATSRTIQANAIAMEIQTLSQSVEAYKTKYQSYPPDGSSRTSFESHFRSVFPQMLASEFAAVYSSTNSNAPIVSGTPTGAMDPAEALVFCLGGFSNNPTNPFTGPGGPLVAVPGGGYQYNVDRNEPLFPFDSGNLTLDTSTGVTISNDEESLGTVPGSNDVMPVYIPKNRSIPIVYFSSNTYLTMGSGSPYFNTYSVTNAGTARPYKSDKVNTKIALTSSTPIPQRDKYYTYMNDKSFQLISGGLDDNYGGSSVFFRFPSGTPCDITVAPGSQPSGASYSLASDKDLYQLDNVTNFSDGALSSTLP